MQSSVGIRVLYAGLIATSNGCMLPFICAAYGRNTKFPLHNVAGV
jgi:hypothetical protein